MRTLHYRSVTRSRVKPATNSPINFPAPEKTAQALADHSATPLDDYTISYRANDHFTNPSFMAQDAQNRSDFAKGIDQQNKIRPSQRLQLLSQRDFTSPTELTKIRRETSGYADYS